MQFSMLKFLEQHPLKDYTTWGIGGPARLFCTVSTINEMIEVMQTDERFLVIGKGSNLLFDDRGFNGLVILNEIDFLEQDDTTFFVGGGRSFSHLGAKTARMGYAGLEFASGIPGTVGGAVYMNAGAGGHETCDVLTEVHFVDSYRLHVLPRKALSFAYRSSPFQTMRGAIVAAKFDLKPCLEAKKRQLDLINYRMKTQPYGEKTCGCVFRNPGDEGAGALIDACGLKGLQIGDIEVSGQHGNFLINRGQGRACDVLKLIAKIKQVVKEKKGIDLEIEVKTVDF